MYKNDILIAKINREYKVTEDALMIYDSAGEHDYSYRGEMLNKISLKDKEFELLELDNNEYDKLSEEL